MAEKQRSDTSQKGGTPRKRKRRGEAPTKAEEAAARGEKLPIETSLERATLIKKVYAAWLKGRSPGLIALDHGISPRRVEKIIEEATAANIPILVTTGASAAAKKLDGMLLQVEHSIQQANEIYDGAIKDKNWAAAVGAHRRIEQARANLIRLMQERGIMPRNLALLTYYAEGRELAARFIEAFDRHGIPLEVAEEVAQAVEMDARVVDGRLALVEKTVDLDDADVVEVGVE